MEYSACQHHAENSTCTAALRQSGVPEAAVNAADTAQGSAPGFLVMDDMVRWSRPVMRCKGIVTGLIISALFWALKILLLIKIFTS